MQASNTDLKQTCINFDLTINNFYANAESLRDQIHYLFTKNLSKVYNMFHESSSSFSLNWYIKFFSVDFYI